MNSKASAGKSRRAEQCRQQISIVKNSPWSPRVVRREGFRAYTDAIKYWTSKDRSIKELVRYGGYAAPADIRRTRLITDNRFYHQSYSVRADGSFGSTLNGWFGGMPHIPGDPEFHEENFIADLDTAPYFMSGYLGDDLAAIFPYLVRKIGERLLLPKQRSRAGYAYYGMAVDQSEKQRAFEEVWDAFREMAEEAGMACMITDLPIRIVAFEEHSGAEPAITQLCKLVGFLPCAKTVDDEDGNVWQQYMYVLPNFRAVTLGELLPFEGLSRDNFERSALWRGINQVSQSAEVLMELFHSGQASHPCDSVLGVIQTIG